MFASHYVLKYILVDTTGLVLVNFVFNRSLQTSAKLVDAIVSANKTAMDWAEKKSAVVPFRDCNALLGCTAWHHGTAAQWTAGCETARRRDGRLYRTTQRFCGTAYKL